MAQEMTLKCGGLYTDPNPLGEIPHGSMRQANNIQIRRLGSAEPRPGFVTKDEYGTDVDAIIPFEGDYTLLTRDSGAQSWQQSGATEITGPALNLSTAVSGLTVSGSGTGLYIYGDDDLLDIVYAYLGGNFIYVTAPDAAYVGEASGDFQFGTRVTSYVQSPGQILLSLTKTLNNPVDAVRVWKQAATIFRPNGIVSAGATSIGAFNESLPLSTHPMRPALVTDSGTLPGGSDTYFAAGTRATFYRPAIVRAGSDYPSLAFDTATLFDIPSNHLCNIHYSDLGIAVGNLAGAPASYTIGETSWAEMNRRLYVTLDNGLARYNDAGDSEHGQAGIAQPGQPEITGATESAQEGWIRLGDMVGYRVVVGREINDQLILSAPSAESYFSPTTAYLSGTDAGVSMYVSLRGQLPPDARVGDLLQLYRTETALAANSPQSPGDEMRLVSTIVLDVANIVGLSWTYDDKTSDDILTGAALYTNETQQGILAANARPPRVGTVATYADMLFGGNVQGKYEGVFGFVGIPGVGPFDYKDPTRLWPGTDITTGATCSFAASSPTVTLTNYFGPEPKINSLVFDIGLDVNDTGGTYFSAGTYVTNAVAGAAGAWTLTLNQNTKAFGGAGTQLALVPFSNSEDIPNMYGNYPSTNRGYVTCSSREAYQGWPNEIGNLISYFGEHFATAGRFAAFTTISGAYYPSLSITWNVEIDKDYTAYFNNAVNTVWRYEDVQEIDSTLATTVTITVGSPTVTISGVDARNAFAVGSYVEDYGACVGDGGGTVFTSGTQITALSFVGSTLTITLSANALANATEMSVWDWISIDGVRYFGATKASFDAHGGKITTSSLFLYDESVLWSLQQLAAVLAYSLDYNWQSIGAGSEARSLSCAALVADTYQGSVTSCKPQGFEDDAVLGVFAKKIDRPNRLVWSKTQEPDAMPLPYFVDVGSASQPILRVLPTRDSLFVFKADGTWRVTGYSPESLRIDEYDRTLRLVHPNALSQIDNNLIGWFVSGVHLVTDATTQNISDNRIGEALGAIRTSPVTSFDADIWAFTAERDNQWHLITGDGATPESNSVYVYNIITDSWVTWTVRGMELHCGIDYEQTGQLLFGGRFMVPSDVGVVLEEGIYALDGSPIALSSVASTLVGAYPEGDGYSIYDVTWFPVSGYFPEVGDVIQHDANILTVIGDAGNDHARCAGATYVPAASTANAYACATATMEWTAKTAQNPGKRKFWREVNYAFDHLQYTYVSPLAFRSDRWATASVDFYDSPDRWNDANVAELPYFLRALIPTESGRAVWLNPKITIGGFTQRWRLEAANLVYNWMEVRT